MQRKLSTIDDDVHVAIVSSLYNFLFHFIMENPLHGHPTLRDKELSNIKLSKIAQITLKYDKILYVGSYETCGATCE